jgi:AcrR family transcriptional regulator
MSTTASSARDRILDTAHRLFYRDGLRATGIDRIIAESGVAKMSFYRNFPSKNDLIEAFLTRRHDEWMQWFVDAVETRLARRNAGLEVIADAMEEWFAEPEFRGCAFINTVAESGAESDAPAWTLASSHKEGVRDYIEQLARRLALPHPRDVADEVMLIIEGMIVRYQMTADPRVISAGRRQLKRLRQA